MTLYPKASLLFVTLCAGLALADPPSTPSDGRTKNLPVVEAASRAEAVDASGSVWIPPTVNDQITQLRNEVQWLSSELARRPKYFNDPEDDKLRP